MQRVQNFYDAGSTVGTDSVKSRVVQSSQNALEIHLKSILDKMFS
jgi:hypothetical protein